MKTVVWTIRVVIFDILGIYLFFIDNNLSITIIVNIRVVGIDIINYIAIFSIYVYILHAFDQVESSSFLSNPQGKNSFLHVDQGSSSS